MGVVPVTDDVKTNVAQGPVLDQVGELSEHGHRRQDDNGDEQWLQVISLKQRVKDVAHGPRKGQTCGCADENGDLRSS
jgi:hypothetical protein